VIRFLVPANAITGQRYTVRFENTGGGTGSVTDATPITPLQGYDLETRSGTVWVGTAASSTPGLITEEWKKYFFSTVTNPDADP
ncbi:hypothetical protein, partial [Escherichia coli]|uniref:hypothetical protein n=1 Tax=Escherichia coli TaxID=562 RepID=UPI00136A4B76